MKDRKAAYGDSVECKLDTNETIIFPHFRLGPSQVLGSPMMHVWPNNESASKVQFKVDRNTIEFISDNKEFWFDLLDGSDIEHGVLKCKIYPAINKDKKNKEANEENAHYRPG